MKQMQSLFSYRISAYEILYSPWQQVCRPLAQLFAEYFPHGFPAFSDGILPLEHAMPVLNRAKSLGYYYQLFPHPVHKMKCCRLGHLHDEIAFEASGYSTEEAILRASALVFLAHRCRLTA